MSEFIVLSRINLGLTHTPTGRAVHRFGEKQLRPASKLKIIKYADDPGVYLLYLDENSQELTDTYHDSVEAAMSQAQWEYQVKPEEWEAL